jgi:uncharacterized protein YheU (UPF0270 family)
MTSNNESGKPDTDESSPEAVEKAEEALDTLMEALAKVTGTMHGLEGREMHRHVENVKEQLHSLVQSTRVKQQDAEARAAAAQQVEKLIDTVAKTGTVAGKALAKQRGSVSQAFRGVDLSKMSDGLRVFAEWLRNPTDAGQVQVEQLIAQLQTTMGPAAAWDEEREAAERRKQIDQQVQSSLDDIFRPKVKKD